MQVNDTSVALNFLPLKIQQFSFSVFRKRSLGEKKEGEYSNYFEQDLPIDSSADVDSKENRAKYWVSFAPVQGFDEFNCQQSFNNWLTLDYLAVLLKERCAQSLHSTEYEIDENGFRRYVDFVLSSYREGREVVWLEPYFLSQEEKFGFLIDFDFKLNQGIPFTRRIQQLSLSLDQNYRSNKNFYIDKYNKLQQFLKVFSARLFPLSSTQQRIDVLLSLQRLPANHLETKHYIFNGNKESSSQYKGIVEHGALEPVQGQVGFFFVCRDQDTDYANQLYKALKGDTFPNNFTGMEKVFGLRMDQVKAKKFRDLNKEALETVISEIRTQQGISFIPIIILPSKSDDKWSQVYNSAKYLFIKEDIPLQFVTLDLLKDANTLKWSVSNIGLQIFAKLGGKPWKVKPTNEKCLIIGIGESHKEAIVDNRRVIEKYFAYSVLTDSSGLYLDMELVGRAQSQDSYTQQIKENIQRIIQCRKQNFKKFVIHTPFKIKKYELDSIRKAIQTVQRDENNDSLEFAVMKINTQNKFFGYDLDANSLVPFESTFVQLSPREYLVWFEGVQYHTPNVYKRFAGPVHIEFRYSTAGVFGKEKSYLQDALNLSGANWRGFNAKALPVSIHYCRLVADFIKDFESLGYAEFQIENLKPWFL
ncbi:MAG: hypothetical protein HZB51_31145 [Chloroflexi bacterium]|nr:hypothetical protein [Chloroflexota bacterium]